MDGAQLTVRFESVSDLGVLYLAGEIDMSTIGSLVDYLYAAIQGHRSWLCVDLAKIAFCDCSGLEAMAAAAAAVRRRGGRYITIHTPPIVLRPIDVLGLRNLLGVVSAPAPMSR